MTTPVGFLLGRPPGPESVLPQVVDHLLAAGASVTAHIAAPGEPIPSQLFDADLVVLRALDAGQLRAAAALEAQGVSCCNSVSATATARDKGAVARALDAAGVPAPASLEVDSWTAVVELARQGSMVIKSTAGSRGRGVLMADGELPSTPPFPGPYLVQQRVDHEGWDRKLYVVGGRISGVLRPWPATTLRDKLGVGFSPDPGLRNVALAAGTALGLEVYGVDVVEGSSGPVVVDVNAWPGFKGVPGAATAIAEHLYLASRKHGASRCAS